jgi:hypothetical protein
LNRQYELVVSNSLLYKQVLRIQVLCGPCFGKQNRQCGMNR